MHNALGSSSSKDQGYRTVKCEQAHASVQTIEAGSRRLPGDGTFQLLLLWRQTVKSLGPLIISPPYCAIDLSLWSSRIDISRGFVRQA